MARGRKGFTLIELLVVIAIIAILAAMLFPVFARARESARKIQCLSNVKNIAMAIQMYLADFDQFFPLEHDRAAADFFNAFGASQGRYDETWPSVCNHARQANPYLREPVVLDEYTRNRQVWQCPSAKLEYGPGYICPMGRGGWWVNNYIDHPNFYDDWMAPPCTIAYPTGWGGSVTDSFVQGMCQDAEAGGLTATAKESMFAESIGINDNMHWSKPSTVSDAAHYITCGECGSGGLWGSHFLAYPDLCYGSSPCGLPDCPEACAADWVNCPWTQDCGLDIEHKWMFYKDPNFRRQHTRHLGGSNVGFLDGHARWYPAETIIFQNGPWDCTVFEGLATGCCWYPMPPQCQ
jgi:prepilin-type N-terminal cleavage/methylation domain-containing protein/prepilin-type processing-associated H-X9-DG protein